MTVRRTLHALALFCAALLALGLLAGAAVASGAEATTSPTGTGGAATDPSANEECFACHGVKPENGTVTTADGQEFPAYIDVAGAAEEHLRRPQDPVQLAARSARLRQLPPRLQRRRAPGGGHPGLAAHRQGPRLRRLPRRRDGDVPGLVPRQPGHHPARRQGAALRRLSRCARHHPAGHQGVPRAGGGDVRPLPRRRRVRRTWTATTARPTRSATRARPYAASATAATGSCRRTTRRAPSRARTWWPRAPSATRAPTRTSPTSART